MREANPQSIYLKDYKPPEYTIDSIELHFKLAEENTRVSSKMLIKRNIASDSSSRDLLLSGENIRLLNVTLEGKKLQPQQVIVDKESLLIKDVPQDRSFILALENTLNPSTNTALEGLYLSKGMLCTQCEAEGFRKITYFLDRPDVMSRFTVTLTGDRDRYPVLLSNGNRIAQGELPDNQHWVTWEDPFHKPCYLFALVAGQLECHEDRYTTFSKRTVTLQIYVEKQDLDKCVHAMQSLQHAMRWDEQVYGREYDLDLYMIVAVGHFNMGAMENKGLNIFNTKYVLARPDTATDEDYEHIEGVIGHEYFHNWTGNRITCRDWFQLSLKEGLTVFRDQEFTADRTSRAVKRIEDVNMLRTRQFAEDAGPLSHPVRPDAYIEINNFYTLTVYEKGAEVVRMLHTLLGSLGFRKGCDLYFQRHDGQAVTCDDFVTAMEDANAVTLAIFRRWYAQAGTPKLHVRQHYSPEQQKLTLTITQSCKPTPGQQHKLPLHIPIRMGLLAADGSVLPLLTKTHAAAQQETIIELTEAEQSFSFEGVRERPVLSLLRGFSAPVKLTLERSTEELALLLRHDTDTFNRWDAGQQLAINIMLAGVDDRQNARSTVINPLIAGTFRELLQQSWNDLSYLSLLLTLPSENYLAEQLPVVDVEAIHQARESLVIFLAQNLQDCFQDLYHRYHREESADFSAAAIGRRRIKNTCLRYLVKLEDSNAYQRAGLQFRQAQNMTDQIAALSCIVNSRHPDKSQCLADFYQQWRNESLVIDKWFALQAGSIMPETFANVQALMRHPAFAINNPNRARSLIGTFSQANQLHFHAANGQGYHFLADQVIALNSVNPQVSSRMLSAFTPWRRFDKKRQALMKTQLERIMTTPEISPDVYEVASKSLA